MLFFLPSDVCFLCNFFIEKRRRAAYHYIKKNIKESEDSYNPPMGQKTRTNDSLLNTKSRPTTKRKEHHGHMLRSPLAPAAHHSLASSLISCIMTSNLGEVPSKTQPFLCFRIHQDTSTTKELKPLRD